MVQRKRCELLPGVLPHMAYTGNECATGQGIVMGCYSTQSELARHDSRAHVQRLTIISTTTACFARNATPDVNITFPLTSSLKHNMNKQKKKQNNNLTLLKKSMQQN